MNQARPVAALYEESADEEMRKPSRLRYRNLIHGHLTGWWTLEVARSMGMTVPSTVSRAPAITSAVSPNSSRSEGAASVLYHAAWPEAVSSRHFPQVTRGRGSRENGERKVRPGYSSLDDHRAG
jgi:hypothetical protein